MGINSMFKTGWTILAGAALAGALTVPAAAQGFNATEVKLSVTTSDLRVISESLGHEIVEIDAEEQMLVARDKEGVLYFMFGTACDVGGVSGCQGIMMQVRYNMPEGVTYETLAKANFEQAALNTWADFNDKTLGVTRYQVLDHGATMANIRENLEVMLSIAPLAAAVAAGEEE